jgi:hypothetical protein
MQSTTPAVAPSANAAAVAENKYSARAWPRFSNQFESALVHRAKRFKLVLVPSQNSRCSSAA